jgi:hypothetical protein
MLVEILRFAPHQMVQGFVQKDNSGSSSFSTRPSGWLFHLAQEFPSWRTADASFSLISPS